MRIETKAGLIFYGGWLAIMVAVYCAIVFWLAPMFGWRA